MDLQVFPLIICTVLRAQLGVWFFALIGVGGGPGT